jgi:hypothetical protein
MLLEIILAISAVILVLLLAFLYAKAQRQKLYAQLMRRSAEIRQTQPAPEIRLPAEIPDFSRLLAAMPDILGRSSFQSVRAEAERLAETERSYIPTHKKGGTIAYETLITSSPAIVALYHSPVMSELVSRITGERVAPTPVNDQSSLSVLFYEKPGDHIGWHYDHDFYRGRHFTVLLPLINRGSGQDGLSHACYVAKFGKEEVTVPTPPNALVVFEGARVLHKATPLAADERRVVISMTYCADSSSTWMQGTARRIKDTAFFGVRALWT